MHMLAVVLAGGFAKRLWPVTRDIAKPLLPLGRQRVIDYVMERLSTLGISRVIVSTNRRFKLQFEPLVEHYRNRFGEVILDVDDAIDEEEKPGALRALAGIFKQYKADAYLVVAGDNILSLDFNAFYRFFKQVRGTTVAIYDVGDPSKTVQYSCVRLQDSRIVEFVEKPSKPFSSLVAIACYIFPREHAAMLSDYLESGGNPDAPGHFIQWLCNHAPVYGFVFKGLWFDIGTKDSYLSALKTLLSESIISSTADVRGKLIHPVVIKDDVIIDEKSVVGPFVQIEEGCRIVNSRIAESVVLERSKIESCTIVKSIVGAHSLMRNLSLRDSILGFYSKVISL